MNYYRTFITMKEERADYTVSGRESMGRTVIESRGKWARITATVQDLKPQIQYRLCLVSVDGEKSTGVTIGALPVNLKGKAELRIEVDAADVNGSGISVEKFNIAAVVVMRDSEIVAPLVGYKDSKINFKHNLKLLEADTKHKEASKAAPPKPSSSVKLEEVSKPAEQFKTKEVFKVAGAKTFESKEVSKAETFISKKILKADDIFVSNPEDNSNFAKERDFFGDSDNDDSDESILDKVEDFAKDSVEAIKDGIGKIFKGEGEVVKEETHKELVKEKIEKVDENFEKTAKKGILGTVAESFGKTVKEGIFGASKESAKETAKEGIEEIGKVGTAGIAKVATEEIAKEVVEEIAFEATRTEETTSARESGENIHQDYRKLAAEFNSKMDALEEFSLFTREELEEMRKPAEVPPLYKGDEKVTELDFILSRNIPMRPFKSFSKDVDWVRISPRELSLLPLDYRKYMRNPLITSGYRKYKHLLLGRISQNGHTRYILGVPDIFSGDYSPTAAELGFRQFKCCEDERPKDGEHGYWIMVV